MEPSISIVGLSKVFPLGRESMRSIFSADSQVLEAESGKIAVDDVSFRIKEGERLGIVGSNGAGKSTLLHMIAGLSDPSSGTIEIEGTVTSVMTLGVGLREELNGRENIYIDGELQGKSRLEIDSVMDQIVEFAELGEFIDYPVRTYSTGMKSRLAFSMIAHIDPEIIVIDEALSVGDAAFSVKATARIREICNNGKIVIIVSHSMKSIREICNRCIWMESGHIVMDGTPNDVTTAYIESVRAEDEEKLMEKFRNMIGVHSYVDGWIFLRADFYDQSSGEKRSLLESGQPVHIEILVKSASNALGANLHVNIERFDGLTVFDEYFHADQFRVENDAIGLEIEMNPLLLGPAIYRLGVSVNLSGKVCAESFGIFEVYALNPPSGGKPTLLYPVHVATACVGL